MKTLPASHTTIQLSILCSSSISGILIQPYDAATRCHPPMQNGGAIYMEPWATITWNSFATFTDNLARDVSSTLDRGTVGPHLSALPN